MSSRGSHAATKSRVVARSTIRNEHTAYLPHPAADAMIVAALEQSRRVKRPAHGFKRALAQALEYPFQSSWLCRYDAFS
jgi:hypothetical protein